MSQRPLLVHPLDRVGIALLIASLACWIGFHLLPIHNGRPGWELWWRIWEITRGGYLPRSKDMIAIAAFLTIAVLITVSPFVTILLRVSKPCRWLAILASGTALLGLGSEILSSPTNGSAAAFLMAAMALNFIGLVCLRPLRLRTEPSAPIPCDD